MLTYEDRLKALRETKIRHTLEKRSQNGYTDLDDFGTVPLPPGYRVTPLYTSENRSFYGLAGMSENFARVMDAHPPYVDPLEMLAGRWRDMLVNYRGDLHYFPAWRKKQVTEEDLAGVTVEWSKRWDEKRFPYDDLKPIQKLYNIQSGIDSDAHLACDYTIGLALGFGGFLEKIAHYRALNPGREAFYDAEEVCVRAIIRFIDRHIEEIQRLLEIETRPEIRENLEEMLKTNLAVRTGKPETFREACQWVAYFNCAARVYTRDGAGFQLDTVLLPYYERDREKGILDDETARFLIADLLLIDPHYYQISGVDENDRDLTNRLSWLILEAAAAIDISANLTVRVHENCDPAFLREAVACLFRYKNGWPRFCSDKNLLEGYMKNGVPKEIARKRIAVGCHWMCVPGVEFPMNDTVKINVARVMEVAIGDLEKEKEPSTEKLFTLLGEHLRKAVEATAAGINLHIDHVAEVTPELVMNLMMRNTLEKGLDISQCAGLYTVGVDGAGLAVVADSFGALETRVEKEGVLTWDRVFRALRENFEGEGGARTRAILASAPKYCGGNTASDRWAKRITDLWVETVRRQEMPAGRRLIPGWFSWARTIEYGAAVGATPNGRKAGEPISHGANPNPGFRRDGAPTAQSNGIASVQCGWGNTAPLQLEFDPGVGLEEGGVELVERLIKTHFDRGGTLININVLDKEKLFAAHQNPDLYPDLVVRVTGFTAYFASLSPRFRQLVVDRFLEGV
ncbi:MAG: formate acetyltransferase [Clostridia bacterium]|nr:formate acetyltransferase [Clostridia bacterium]